MTLRPPQMGDVPAIVEGCRDPEVARWTNVPSPYEEQHARRFVQGTMSFQDEEMSLVITDASRDDLLGAIGLRLPYEHVGDVGYWVGASARGRGVATRAVRLLCEWAFEELGLARIQLHTLPGNTASQRVAEKAGFTREGVLRSWTEMKGKRVDLVMFSLLPGELTPAR